MSHRGSEDLFLESLFPEDMNNVKVMDVGVGYGKTGWWIRSILGFNRGWCQLHGIEIYKPYYEHALRLGYYDRLTNQDALKPWLYSFDFFDISIAQQTIEHMSHGDGLKLLANMEKHTKGRVILCTPNGYTESSSLDGNENNNHLSGWTPEDFEELGYNTKILVHKQSSRAVALFHKYYYLLRNSPTGVIVAWKDKQ